MPPSTYDSHLTIRPFVGWERERTALVAAREADDDPLSLLVRACHRCSRSWGGVRRPVLTTETFLVLIDPPLDKR